MPSIQYTLCDDGGDYIVIRRGGDGIHIEGPGDNLVYIADEIHDLFIEHIGKLNGKID